MTGFAIALGLTALDKVLGVSNEASEHLAASERMNREGRIITENIAQSTNAIWQQLAINGMLLAEEQKNVNIRRQQQIQNDRRTILGS